MWLVGWTLSELSFNLQLLTQNLFQLKYWKHQKENESSYLMDTVTIAAELSAPGFDGDVLQDREAVVAPLFTLMGII